MVHSASPADRRSRPWRNGPPAPASQVRPIPLLAAWRDSGWLARIIMAYVVILSVAGGGPPVWGLDTLAIGLCSLILIVSVALSDGMATLRSFSLPVRIALIGIVVLPLLQLIPLPPAWWQALPGAPLRIEVLSLAGLADRWQPLSLEPVYTAYSAAMGMAFVALVAGTARLDTRALHAVLWLLFLITATGLVLGVIQVGSGGMPIIQDPSDKGFLIGWMANKNHMALMLAVSVPWFHYLMTARGGEGRFITVMTCAYMVLVLPCLVATNSRAGLGLGILACAWVGMALMRNLTLRYRLAMLLGFAGLAGMVVMSSAFDIVFTRMNAVQEDGRWQIVQDSQPLIHDFWLWGSGVGSFSNLFQTRELLAWLTQHYVNQMHNEYLQVLVEFGLAGVALLLLFVVAVAGQAWHRLSESGNPLARLRNRTAVFTLLLFAIHSVVDYPLRRPACLVMFAVALAIIVRRDKITVPARRAVPASN